MSKFIDVFQFTGSAMQEKGDFIALMIFAMACGCFVVYFLVGWTSNIVAQVPMFAHGSIHPSHHG